MPPASALECPVALQRRKEVAALAGPVARDPRHREPRGVMQDRERHAAEEREGLGMAVTERPRRLGMTGLPEDRGARRRIHDDEPDLPLDAAARRGCLPTARPGVSRRAGRRQGYLPAQLPARPEMVVHRRAHAAEHKPSVSTAWRPDGSPSRSRPKIRRVVWRCPAGAVASASRTCKTKPR